MISLLILTYSLNLARILTGLLITSGYLTGARPVALSVIKSKFLC